jgi:acyl-CoA synthetase (AMP-forming)/AMP-acid ligase II
MNIPLTPLRFLRYAKQQYPRRTAVVCNQESFTYAQFADRSRRLAGALRQAGVQPGDRVAFLSANCHRLLEAYYGVLEAGAVLLPLNIRLAESELSYILNDSGATILFVEKQFLRLVESFRTDIPNVKQICQLDGAPEAAWLSPRSYEALLQEATPYRADITSIDENSLAELFYTSGTSANPKGVMLTHRNIYLHALNVCLGFNIENGAVELHTIPLYHANGWGVAHFLTLLGGEARHDAALRDQRNLPPHRKGRRPFLQPRSHHGHGSGELPGTPQVQLEQPAAHRYRRRGVFPDASAEALRGSWFRTGDMATLNEEGYLLIVDRKKDIIVSGGENISSLELEKAILAHPAVLEAGVIPVPEEKWGEVPKALVVLKPNAVATEPELIEFCRLHLAHYKCPRSFEFVVSLPKTGTGKILKKDLRKKYWHGRDTMRPDFAVPKRGN